MSNSFENWLIEIKGYQYKSAKDVKSRINRLENFQDSLPVKIDDNFIASLGKNKEFMELSTSVRSQLRRAAKLLIEYAKTSTSEQTKKRV